MSIKNEIIETHGEQETINFAREFAQQLSAGDVVLLRGDLGMGKSVISRAIIRALCGDEGMDVPSPTFTIVQTYESPKAEIWHFDLYRLADPSEIYEIGWEEALIDGISLVEWPECLGNLVPSAYIELSITAQKAQRDYRKIEVRSV